MPNFAKTHLRTLQKLRFSGLTRDVQGGYGNMGADIQSTNCCPLRAHENHLSEMNRFRAMRTALSFLTVTQFVVGWPQAALAATYCVDANGHNSNPPFAGWTTAATNIQDAVNLATTNDVVLVTNGVYQYGGAPAA